MSESGRKFAEGGAARHGRARRRLEIVRERWPLKTPMQITGYRFTEIEVIVVMLSEGGFDGRGEAAGVYYLMNDPAQMAAQIEFVRAEIENGASREELQRLLPCGGARNAVDCALWDLEAGMSGQPVWALAGLAPPEPLVTTFTIGAADAEETARAARSYADATALKLKLTGETEDVERVRAARRARPDVWLGVDANEGYTRERLEAILPAFLEAGVSLIEQPLPAGMETGLKGLQSPIPLAADESVQGMRDIAPLAGLVDVINIKLDKCGGLTEGLAMAAEARRHGMKVMVGNMVGTSLSTAPAYMLGQQCDLVDLDGPFLLTADREPPVSYRNGTVFCPPEVWGAARPAAGDSGPC